MHRWILFLCLTGMLMGLRCGWMITATATASGQVEGYELPFGPNPFAPSNARTTTGTFIRQEDFIPATRCAGCHTEAHSQWNESVHRNSFREPFYQANVKHLIKDRSLAVTRHCESCHNPVALFSGALSDKAKFARPFDEEGVTCAVCHSIQSTTTEGIGSYVIAPPALLERADGTRVAQVSDEELRADIESHRRAMMRPLLKTPEFCAACHKAAVVPEMNQRKWLRSFAVYDEWQQSAFSQETTQPLAKRDRQSCQSCHMPQMNGIPSHRWPGANTAVPDFYGFKDQFAATEKLLKSGILTIEIFPRGSLQPSAYSHQPETTKEQFKILNSQFSILTVDVVVANRGVGHAFPAELRDIFEAWLEVAVTDAAGEEIFHSGAIRPDGKLDEEAHAYRTVPIDDQGQPITRHDIWNTRMGAFDRHIPAGRADLGRFQIPVTAATTYPLTIQAKVNYRRLNRNFTDWVALTQPVKPAPVVEMAARSVTLSPQSSATGPQPFQAWRSYGVALFDQQQYEAAVFAFDRAHNLAADQTQKVSVLIDGAMTRLRLERAGTAPDILSEAEKALTQALALEPQHPRARYWLALLRIKRFQYTEAVTILRQLSVEFPRDRQVWMQLGNLFLLQYQDGEAMTAFQKVLEIDPDDPEAHQKIAGLLWRSGDYPAAKREQAKYTSYHNDNAGETLRRAYLRQHPGLFQSWPWREFGDNPIGSLP
ncbi:MAG: tetratricopeptide repeat protein [Blastocatellia bacterium]|nr:tetratricopeptide repeat protein [Blastocatellia bacterium]